MKKSILVVDDSHVVVSMLSDMLEGLGFDVTGALGGMDGLAHIEQHRYDMIITDLNMPEMGGVEFTEKAKKHPNCKFVPIVMISGEDDTDKIGEAKRIGISTFLHKPVKEAQLKAILQIVLGSSATPISPQINKKRILVVDDSPLVLTQLTDELCGDYDVVCAESGEAAVKILEDPVRGGVCFSNEFDLIITDLKMPGMSGFEFSSFVRKRNKVNKHTPVVLLTTEKVSKEEARQHGCMAYFSKSDKKRLLAFVRIIL